MADGILEEDEVELDVLAWCAVVELLLIIEVLSSLLKVFDLSV